MAPCFHCLDALIISRVSDSDAEPLLCYYLVYDATLCNIHINTPLLLYNKPHSFLPLLLSLHPLVLSCHSCLYTLLSCYHSCLVITLVSTPSCLVVTLVSPSLALLLLHYGKASIKCCERERKKTMVQVLVSIISHQPCLLYILFHNSLSLMRKVNDYSSAAFVDESYL